MRFVDSVHAPGTVGVISHDLARYTSFYDSLEDVLVPHGTVIERGRGNGIAANRNHVARLLKGEWLWLLDDDHAFPPETLLRLLHHGVDIVAPLCLTRKPPFHCYGYVYNGHTQRYDGALYEDLPRDLIEFDAVGTGLMLVHRRVFEAMPEPWFEEGKLQPDLLSEDLHFCAKARELGFRVHLDATTEVAHSTIAHIWPTRTDDGRWAVDIELRPGVRVRVAPDFGALGG